MNQLAAELYALTHRGNAGDVRFYRKICRKAGSVLELGTGYGRLLPARSLTSERVTGLELDRALLALAAESARALPRAQRDRLTLVQGDMQRFAFGAEFDRILLPYNGLYCLLTRRAIVECFRNVRAHLAPDGLFVGDVWAADAFHRASDAGGYHDESGPILSIARGARVWDVLERSQLRRREQRLGVTYTYVPRHRGRTVAIRIDQRYVRFRELAELLGRAGLRLSAVYGDFAGNPRRAHSPHLVFAARAV